MDFAKYVQQANEQTLVLLQIEHVEGVRNIDAILQVPGVDAIIVVPYDLSGSFAKLRQLQDPEVQEAILTIHKACKRHEMPIGSFLFRQNRARLSKARLSTLGFGNRRSLPLDFS